MGLKTRLIKVLYSLAFLISSNSLAASARAPYEIVHTGVLKTFSDTGEITPGTTEAYSFRGQDANYTRNLPSYTDKKNGVIFDNITGLSWAKDMPPKLNYEEAKNHVSSMNQTAFGGRTDWRIPSVKELYSLIKFDGEVLGETYVGKPFIDTRFFTQPIGNKALGERDIDAQNWTSTRYVAKVMQGNGPGFEGQDAFFGVNFIDGRIKGYPYTSPQGPAKYYLRAVAGNPSYGTNNFIDRQNGVVHDLNTRLMWTKYDFGGEAYSWRVALTYCEDLNYGGFSDWRLPNIKELHSIVDYSRAPSLIGSSSGAAINPIFHITSIPNQRQGVYYTQYPFFWSSTTHIEGPTKGDHAAYMAFGEALGYFSPVPNAPAQVLDVHGAGAQRSDTKAHRSSISYFGPQGDISYAGNFGTCVRYN
jgi:hypothetical protein